MSTPIEALWVVVPCHDEAALLGRFLHSLRGALDTVRAARPEVDVRVALVLDACTDDSAAVVEGAGCGPEIVVTAVAHRSVGRARAVGVDLLRSGGSAAPAAAATWLACTDADGEVPPGWLLTHLDAAERGADLLLGSVLLSEEAGAPSGLDASMAAEWRRRHPATGPHTRVHGANLGVRLDAYDRVGGFADVAYDEDVRLVAALRALPGIETVSTHEAPVRTSARTRGRTPWGFAGYLARLGEPQQAVQPGQPGQPVQAPT